MLHMRYLLIYSALFVMPSHYTNSVENSGQISSLILKSRTKIWVQLGVRHPFFMTKSNATELSYTQNGHCSMKGHLLKFVTLVLNHPVDYLKMLY